MKIILYTIIFIVLLGCENGNIVLTDEARADEKEISKKRGLARIELFKICMKLSSGMPRESDDDVSYVVDSCSQKSHYMTNYIK